VRTKVDSRPATEPFQHAGLAVTESIGRPPLQPDFVGQFRACYVDDATGRFEGESADVELVLETRYATDEQVEIFTTYQGIEHRALSVNELVSQLPALIELRIPQPVPIEFDGVVRTATFVEVYRPSSSNRAFEDTVKAVLEIGTEAWESPWTDFLGDALTELHGIAPPWRFRTCVSCVAAGHPTGYVNNEQLLWCYRDAPGALAEYSQSGRFAGGFHAFAGQYWVRAFHRCSAWRPRTVVT
jgi:hypothetical protein